MRLLSVDLETSPNVVYRWGLYDKGPVPIDFIVDPSRVLCFAAAWVDEPGEPEFFSEFHHGADVMVEALHYFFDTADVLLHYNGTSFDEKKANAEFVKVGLLPPSPYQRIDLYKAVKSKFSFPSGKLDYVCKALELGQKTRHGGFDLWKRCLAGEAEAWETMKLYNTQDVILNIDLFHEILPWIPNLPSHGAETGEDVCPGCGRRELRKEGHAFTKTGKYQRYRCAGCGTWSKASKREHGTGIVQVAS